MSRILRWPTMPAMAQTSNRGIHHTAHRPQGSFSLRSTLYSHRKDVFRRNPGRNIRDTVNCQPYSTAGTVHSRDHNNQEWDRFSLDIRSFQRTSETHEPHFTVGILFSCSPGNRGYIDLSGGISRSILFRIFTSPRIKICKQT